MPFITSVVLIIAGSAPAHAQGAELPPLIERAPRLSEGVFGIGAGLAVGEPTGFNIALRNEALHTVSSTVGWNLSAGRFHAHSDYQVPFTEITPTEGVLAMTLYAGLGATLDIGDAFALGARVPVVAAISFDKPLEVFVELAPVIGVLPDVGVGVQASTGIRGWFKPNRSDGDGLEVRGE